MSSKSNSIIGTSQVCATYHFVYQLLCMQNNLHSKAGKLAGERTVAAAVLTELAYK